MEIPGASDGRVGSALRAAWCWQGLRPSRGSQACSDREALPLKSWVLLRAPSTQVRAGIGVTPWHSLGSAGSGAVGGRERLPI